MNNTNKTEMDAVQVIHTLKNALHDFIDFHNDPNMPIDELVNRAEESLKIAEYYQRNA
jgi:hypothetical protein